MKKKIKQIKLTPDERERFVELFKSMLFQELCKRPQENASDMHQRGVLFPCPEETMKRWAQSLRFFRFVNGLRGHADEPDSLVVAISYNGIKDLKDVLKTLGMQSVEYAERPAQPEVGKPYPREEFEKFPSLVPGSLWLKQPGNQDIAGVHVFVWCYKSRIKISIINCTGDRFSVSERDVSNASKVEPFLASLAERIIDPPEDTNRCICPKYYPQYF